ncbi:MAG: hypothetical protein HGA22_14565 [Clostridiales bacterium]|nr:hypothetical protein [Clostridiales bacterium]
MENKELQVSRDAHGLTITARALFSGNDIAVVVSGGDKPHIGSVSTAIPHEPLNGPGDRSSTVSTINLTGHRDNEIGDIFAREIARQTGRVCVVACGVHIDKFAKADVEWIMLLARSVLEEFIEKI